MPEDNLYTLWQNVSKEYNLPDYETFRRDMQDKNKLNSFYKNISSDYQLPEFDVFVIDMGLKKKVSAPVSQVSTKGISPSVSPSVTGKPGGIAGGVQSVSKSPFTSAIKKTAQKITPQTDVEKEKKRQELYAKYGPEVQGWDYDKIQQTARATQKTNPEFSTFLYEQAAAKNPADPTNFSQIAHNKMIQGDYEAAVENANAALTVIGQEPLKPGVVARSNPGVNLVKSYSELKLGNNEDAEKSATEAAKWYEGAAIPGAEKSLQDEDLYYKMATAFNYASIAAKNQGNNELANNYINQQNKAIGDAHAIEGAKYYKQYNEYLASDQFQADLTGSLPIFRSAYSAFQSGKEVATELHKGEDVDVNKVILGLINTGFSIGMAIPGAGTPMEIGFWAGEKALGAVGAEQISNYIFAPTTTIVEQMGYKPITATQYVDIGVTLFLLHKVSKAFGSGMKKGSDYTELKSDVEIARKMSKREPLTENEAKKVQEVVDNSTTEQYQEAIKMTADAIPEKFQKKTETVKEAPELKEEIDREKENIDLAIEGARMSENKKFEGVGLDELLDDKNLLDKNPEQYFAKQKENYLKQSLDETISPEGRNEARKLYEEYNRIHKKYQEQPEFKAEELDAVAKELHDKKYSELDAELKSEVEGELSERKSQGIEIKPESLKTEEPINAKETGKGTPTGGPQEGVEGGTPEQVRLRDAEKNRLEAETGKEESRVKKSPEEIAKEKSDAIHNHLVSMIKNYNRGGVRAKKDLSGKINKTATDLGYQIKFDGSAIRVLKNGKNIKTIAKRTGAEEKATYKTLIDYDKDFQDMVNGMLEFPESSFNQLSLGGLGKKNVAQGIRDISLGKKSVAANDLLRALDEMHKSGIIEFVEGSGGATHYSSITIEEFNRVLKDMREEKETGVPEYIKDAEYHRDIIDDLTDEEFAQYMKKEYTKEELDAYEQYKNGQYGNEPIKKNEGLLDTQKDKQGPEGQEQKSAGRQPSGEKVLAEKQKDYDAAKRDYDRARANLDKDIDAKQMTTEKGAEVPMLGLEDKVKIVADRKAAMEQAKAELDKVTPEKKDSAQTELDFTQKAKNIADSLRKGKIDDDILMGTIPFAKEAWNGTIEIMAQAIEAGGKLADVISDGLKYLKNTDWYKGLTDEKKQIAEEKITAKIKDLEKETKSKVESEINTKYGDIETLFFGSKTPVDAEIKAGKGIPGMMNRILGFPQVIQEKIFGKEFDIAGDKLAKVMAKEMTIRGWLPRVTIKALNGILKDFTRTKEERSKGEEFIGTSKERSVSDANKINQNLHKYLNNDPVKLERIQRVMDPDFFRERTREEYVEELKADLGEEAVEKMKDEKIDSMYAEYRDLMGFDKPGYKEIKYKDLTPDEQIVADQLRMINDFVHDVTFVTGGISFETYLKNKGSYSARFYEPFEMPEDIVKDMTAAGIKMDLSGTKQRGGVTNWKIENRLQDPVYDATKRLQQALLNKGVYDYSKYISKKSGYISKIERPGFTQLNGRAYGELNGKFVRDDIVEDFKGFFYADKATESLYNFLKAYNRFSGRQFFKSLFTRWNPSVRVGNQTGNIVFSSLLGISPIRFEITYQTFARNQIKTYGEYYRYLMSKGLLNSDFSKQDLANAIKDLDHINDTAAKSKNPIGYLTGAGKWVNEWVNKTYQKADDLAKIAAFKCLIDMGLTPEAALNRVANGFQNFKRVGKTYDIYSKTPVIGNPFGKFSGDLQRIIRSGILTRPLNYVGFIAALKGIATLSSSLSGETDEDRAIREGRTGFPKIPLPKWVGGDVPLAFKVGENELNVARFISPYYIYTTPDEDDVYQSILRVLPYSIDPIGKTYNPEGRASVFIAKNTKDPVLGPIINVLANSDFRGLPILDPKETRWQGSTITQNEKYINAGRFLARSYVPYGSYGDDFIRAMSDEEDYYGRKKTPVQVVLRFLGYNSQVFDDSRYNKTVMSKLAKPANDFVENSRLLNIIRNQYEKEEITEDNYKKRGEELIIKNAKLLSKIKSIMDEFPERLTKEKITEVLESTNFVNEIRKENMMPEEEKNITEGEELIPIE